MQECQNEQVTFGGQTHLSRVLLSVSEFHLSYFLLINKGRIVSTILFGISKARVNPLSPRAIGNFEFVGNQPETWKNLLTRSLTVSL